MAARIVEEWTPAPGHLGAGGCFICFRRRYSAAGERGEPAWCAAVWMHGRRIVEHAVVTSHAGDAYAPGLLALREGRALEATVRLLRQPPRS